MARRRKHRHPSKGRRCRSRPTKSLLPLGGTILPPSPAMTIGGIDRHSLTSAAGDDPKTPKILFRSHRKMREIAAHSLGAEFPTLFSPLPLSCVNHPEKLVQIRRRYRRSVEAIPLLLRRETRPLHTLGPSRRFPPAMISEAFVAGILLGIFPCRGSKPAHTSKEGPASPAALRQRRYRRSVEAIPSPSRWQIKNRR